MLDYLRRNASSWVVKLVLGLIAVSFAIFFGFSSSRNARFGEKIVAMVGDEPIPYSQFNEAYDRASQGIRSDTKGEISEEFDKFLRYNILNQLIRRKTQLLFIRDLGLKVSDEELARYIRNQKEFYRDGMFDMDNYNNRFRPYYQRRFGQDFEEAVEEDLLLDLFGSMVSNGTIASPVEGKWREEMSKSKEQKPVAGDSGLQTADPWLDEFQRKINIQKNPDF